MKLDAHNMITRETPKRILSSTVPRVYSFDCIVGWVTLILCPILSLPLIAIGIYNRKNYAVYQLITFLGLLAFLLPPTGDLYRYYSIYYLNFKDINYLEIFNFYIFDFGWYSVLYCLVNLNIPFQYSQVISCTIQLLTTLYLIKKNIININNSNAYKWLILSSFLYTGFWTPIEARFYVSLSIFLLSIYYYSKNCIIKAIFGLVIASIIHFSFLIFSFIFFLVIILRKHISVKSAFIFFIIIYLSIWSIGQYIENFGLTKAVYITQSTDWTEGASLTFKIFKNWLLYIPSILLIFYLLFNKNKTLIGKLSLVLLALTLATIDLPDLNTRFKIVTQGILWLNFISSISFNKFKWVRTFFIFSLLSFVINTALVYKALNLGKYQDLILPVPYILTKDIYTDKWIQAHIENGKVI